MLHLELLKNRISGIEKLISSSCGGELPTYEVMELILSFFINEKDLKIKTQRMLERFGTVSVAMDSDISRITDVLENEAAAIFFKSIPILSEYYRRERFLSSHRFEDVSEIAEYCSFRFLTDTRESVLVILLDEGMRVMGVEQISEGDGVGVYVDLERLAAVIFGYGASSFILIHNHPSGEPLPSENDVTVTERVQSIFRSLGKTLIEHLIIAKNQYVPLLQMLRG